MSRRTRYQQNSRTASQDSSEPTFTLVRANGWLLAAFSAVLTAQVLLPSESQAQRVLPLVMVLLTLGGAWSLVAVLAKSAQLRFGSIDIALLGMFGWIALSGMVATQTGAPRDSLNALWNWLGLGMVYFFARQLIVTHQQRNAVAAVMMALAAAASVHGGYQAFYELPRTFAEYEADPEGTLRAAGQWSPESSAERAAFRSRLANPEPFAMFALTNSLAGLLVAWWIVAAGIAAVYFIQNFWVQDGPKVKFPTIRLGVGLCAALLLIGSCLALTQSRAGYAAAAIGIATLAFVICFQKDPLQQQQRRARLMWAVALTTLVVVVVAVLLAIFLREHSLIRDAGKSLGYRLEYWEATSKMIADYPLLGVGPGNFQSYYPHYQLPQSSETIADPHNFVMELASNAGLLAAVLMLVAMGLIKWRILYGQPPDEPSEAVAMPRASGPVYCAIGGMSGILLAVLLGKLFPGLVIPLTLSQAVVYALVAGSIGALLWPMVYLRLPRGIFFAALSALAVHLLASGGISFAGVSGTWWLLVAFCLVGNDPAQRTLVLSQVGALCLLLVFTLLSVACYFTAYAPVTAATWRVEAARQQYSSGNRAAADQLLREAAAADPWSPEPHLVQAATLAYQANDESSTQKFAVHVDRWHALAPHAWQPRSQAGDWFLLQWRASSDAELLSAAIRHYEAAVARFPNGSITHAELAWAYSLQGNVELARRHAAEAIRLDKLNPHTERSLDTNQVRLADPEAVQASVLELMHRIAEPATDEVLLLKN